MSADQPVIVVDDIGAALRAVDPEAAQRHAEAGREFDRATVAKWDNAHLADALVRVGEAGPNAQRVIVPPAISPVLVSIIEEEADRRVVAAASARSRRPRSP